MIKYERPVYDIMDKNVIRIAKAEDAEGLLNIYEPYVRNTAITFEYTVPSVDEFRLRIEHILQKYPYLVAERNGVIAGYAYAGPFKGRAAYDRAVETTIYVRQDLKRTGIGRELYYALEKVLSHQNFLNLYACIGYPQVEDEYLTKNSVWFHEHIGYRIVGHFYNCGYKFGRWYDMVWMEKFIGTHTDNPPAVKWFAENKKELSEITELR